MKEVIVPADDLVCIGKEKLQEVIRCKDCKYHDYGRCAIWEYCKTEDDYFCKDGERKEE